MQPEPRRGTLDRVVIGAIGPWKPSIFDRLVESAPSHLRERFQSPHARLLTADEPGTYERGGHFWDALVGDTSPTSWQSASEERMAAGIVVRPGHAILHSCALGVQDVYVREIAGAAYFSNRIDPLVGLTSEKLATNWAAWASTIALCAPFGDATPFEEISRLEAASAIEYTDALRHISYEPAYMGAIPRRGIRAVTPLEMAALLSEAIPVTGSGGPALNVTLSGGWDSRLLAALAARRSALPLWSWTTSPDDGYDEDLVFARPLARLLGAKHTEVVPDSEGWVDRHLDAYRAFEHQTWLHTWILPLADRVRATGGPVLDGVAGGILLKSAFISAETLNQTRAEHRRDLLFTALTGGRTDRPDIYASSGLDWIRTASRGSFDRLTGRLEGHPSELSLHALLGRTVRGICPSSMRLYGDVRKMMVPYLHPLIVKRALEVPEAVKMKRTFNRQVIETAAGPAVARLPSTNDPRERGVPMERRQASRAALMTMADRVVGDPVVSSLLDEKFRTALQDPERLIGLGRWTSPVQILQAMSMFAHWRSTYAARLRDEMPPWLQ